MYILIFTALVILTVTTVYAATVDLNEHYAGLNVIVALVIATCKALLVALLHARILSTKRTQLIIIAGVFGSPPCSS
jgi:caa(3)-type oxidase subunit IV